MNKRPKANSATQLDKPRFVKPDPRPPHRKVLIVSSIVLSIWIIALAVIALTAA